MKNGLELFVAELFAQFERRQILRDEIAAVAAQIFKITGTKIIDHREARFRKFFLQREREVGADEAGAAGNEKIGSGLWHVGWNCSGAGPPVQFPVIPTEV